METPITDLVQRAKEGDQDAVSELYERSRKTVYWAARSLIQDEDAVLDVMQDSYVKAFRYLDSLKEPEKFCAWMKIITKKQALDYLKKKNPIPFSALPTEEEDEKKEREVEDMDISHIPEFAMDRQVTAELIDQILGTLSPEQREAVVMHYYQDMTEKEIAQVQHCSVNTVKSRISYGKKKIEKAVVMLEKKEGIRLYSLAPLPYFLWLLRTAEAQGVATEVIGSTAAVATAAGGASASAAVAGKTGATAASAGGKAVATKVVAGALAVTVAGGAVAVANSTNIKKQNEQAHTIYEAFIDRYQEAFEMDQADFYMDYCHFWDEITENILDQNPDADPMVIQSWYLDYNGGDTFENGIPLPRTVYEPNMNALWLLKTKIEDETFCYAFLDMDSDGIDELVTAQFYRGEIYLDTADIYTIENGVMVRGNVQLFYGNKTCPAQEADYVDLEGYSNIVYIDMGQETFGQGIQIPSMEISWKKFFGD